MSVDRIRAYLSKDPLSNIAQLKILRQYDTKARLFFRSQDTKTAVAIILNTPDSHFYSSLYPNANYVIFPVADDPELLHNCFAEYQQHSPILLASPSSEISRISSRYFKLQHMRSYLSFTSDEPLPGSGLESVKFSEGIIAQARPLFEANNYGQQELDQFDSWGGKTFYIESDGEIVCACFIFPNIDNVWEVSGLRTLESHQGRGLAKMVTRKAINHIQSQGNTLRYQVEETNVASISLAKSIGLRQFMKLSHYLANKLN